MNEPLKTGAVIGILGGGQLGRILCISASRLGLRGHIFDPSSAPPAADVAYATTSAAYEDEDALRRFAAEVDVITYEFENIPTSALDILENLRPIRPGREALRISQDRLTEKDFLTGLGLKTAPYRAVDTRQDLTEAVDALGLPAILKTRRFGYDGKGQARLSTQEDQATAIAEMAGQAAVLEGFISFSKEISIIGARNSAGDVACFDPGENIHQAGILRTTTVPAQINATQRMDAVLLAAKIMNALDYVGVMGVELFVTEQGLIVNEIAPRVHNSGHWTQNGCAVDQFEQHIRAIANWPLADGSRHSDVTMTNLIGDDLNALEALSSQAGTALHLYGKAEIKPGRKMGHYNSVRPKS